jgi:SAM-dependent methyltransferase
MKAIDDSGFESKFRQNIDPWDYTNSPFEHFKRGVLLRACGHFKRGRALEIGCAIGETTRHLASLCLTLVAIDGSATALAEARRRLQRTNVRFVNCVVPEQMPRGPFDLIVASEIAYYLPRHRLDALGRAIISALAPRGLVVLLHHHRPFDDAAQLPALAHRRICRQLKANFSQTLALTYPRFNVAAFQKHGT